MGFVIPVVAAIGSTIAGATAAVTSAVGATAAAGATAATASTMGLISTGLSAAGALYGGVSSYKAGQYQAKVLGMQAKYAEQQREQALIAGSERESQIKTAVGRTLAAQKAATAGNGVDVGVGSSVDIANSTRLEGAADVATAHWQALQEAYGFSQEAWNARANASLAKAEGKNKLIGSVFDAASTVIGGASSLAKKNYGLDTVGLGKPKSIDDILRASPKQRLAWGS